MEYMRRRIFLNVFIYVVSAIFLTGCATTRNAPPAGTAEKAKVMGVRDVYVFADEPTPKIIKDIIASIYQESPGDFPSEENEAKSYSILAISGGAEDGAYGAGVLKGWNDSGKQPKFKIVTGISTGAIIAPFAFLGKEHYDVVKKIYTTMSTNDVMKKYSIIHPLYGTSFASNKPLEGILDKIITKEVIEEIAAQHACGRRLYIGTTNLDAQRLAVWDMGRIASGGGEKAKKLFSKVILASTSIPILFPPVIFEVTLNGEGYNEMHVDGGIITQVCALNVVLKGVRSYMKKEGLDPDKLGVDLYVIRNGYVYPRWNEVPDTFFAVTQRAVNSLLSSQGTADLYRLYAFSEEEDIDYNLTFIPSSFTERPKEMFDLEYMRKLFKVGYKIGFEGKAWSKEPPEL